MIENLVCFIVGMVTGALVSVIGIAQGASKHLKK